MAKDMNRLFLLGRLGNDPQIKYTSGGTKICEFSIAVNIGPKDREITNWWNVSAFDRDAEMCEKNIKKGQTVIVFGEPRQKRWTGKDGIERFAVNVYLDDIIWLPFSEGYNHAEP